MILLLLFVVFNGLNAREPYCSNEICGDEPSLRFRDYRYLVYFQIEFPQHRFTLFPPNYASFDAIVPSPEENAANRRKMRF